MKPPSRKEIVNKAWLGPIEPERMEPFRGTQEDFDYLAAMLRMAADFLKRSDIDKWLNEYPELEAIFLRLHENSQRLYDIIKFATADRAGVKYGLTGDQFWDLVMAQNWSCTICGCLFEPGGPRMNVDHNHDTQEVRGILCSSCNTGLGMFKDRPDVLAAALAYLETRGHYGVPH